MMSVHIAPPLTPPLAFLPVATFCGVTRDCVCCVDFELLVGPEQLHTDILPAWVVFQFPSHLLGVQIWGHFLCASTLFQIGPAFSQSAFAGADGIIKISSNHAQTRNIFILT